MAQTEAHLAVQDILRDVIETVYEIEEIGSASFTRPRRNGPHFDLCGVARDRCTLLKSYSLYTTGRIEVCQVKCVEQKGSGYCGHYAFYFSLNLLKLCSCTSQEEAALALGQLTNRGHFWKRYWINITRLLSEVSPDSWWPWTREHVHGGEIERSYLKHLLQCDLSPQDRDRTFAIHFGYGMLQDSYEHIKRVQRAIKKFVNGKINYLMFILGVTNHWVSLLAYKYNGSKIGLMYCDSNNEPVLAATDHDIEELVKAREERHKKRKGVGYENWKRNTLRQSFYDQRDLVALLTECLQGAHTLPSVLVSGHWESLLTNYHKNVSSVVTGAAGDGHIVRLLHWLESGYSVSALRNTYIKPLVYFGAASLTQPVKSKLEVWVMECSTVEPIAGLEQINSFIELVHQVATLLRT